MCAAPRPYWPQGGMHAPCNELPISAQIVLAVIGAYAGIIGLVKLKMSLSKKPAPKAAPAAAAAPVAVASAGKWGFETPTLENFDAWSANADNWKKWEAFMDGDGVNKWAESLT